MNASSQIPGGIVDVHSLWRPVSERNSYTMLPGAQQLSN